LRQKYTETISDYLRWFREVRNMCYNLTIAQKDLTDLAFVGLTPYLKNKLDGREFSNTNQLVQCALPYENRAKSSRFWDNTNKDKEKLQVHFLEEEADNEEGNEIYAAEWVEKPRDKPISCSFLKLNGRRRDEMRYTFDVTKCDRLFDLLLRGGVI
jgi:DNA-directed RNA polymerase subunit M/transcription elongation factor TFIIS